MPITHALEKMGAKAVKEKNNEVWYISPFRNEKTASLHVHTLNNVWYDFGEEIGGDIIKLICFYLERNGEDHQVADALRWLRNMSTSYKPIEITANRNEVVRYSKIEVKRSGKLTHLGLTRYLEGRGIPPHFATKHVRELYVRNNETGKSFYTIAFKNENGGWELRNPFFKGCIAPKTISFIRGVKAKPDEIHIFEGFMDYLSIVAQEKHGKLEGDTIVLNSLSCISQALPYIRNYGYKSLYSWLDNDEAGQRAIITFSLFARTQEGLTHQPMNDRYMPHKDVNAWHMHRLGLFAK